MIRLSLHHVQLAMPQGLEGKARDFYAGALGLTEVEKPAELARRGGCWFRQYVDGAVTLEFHLGVEADFRPAAKAHPAILVDSVQALDALAENISGHGFEVDSSERTTFDGYLRFHCKDPFGNRLEVLAADSGSVQSF